MKITKILLAVTLLLLILSRSGIGFDLSMFTVADPYDVCIYDLQHIVYVGQDFIRL